MVKIIIIIDLISMNIRFTEYTIAMYLFVIKSSWKFCGKSTIDWIQRKKKNDWEFLFLNIPAYYINRITISFLPTFHIDQMTDDLEDGSYC